MRALIEEAARMGVQIHVAVLDDDLRGFYSHRLRVIVVRLGLSRAQMRETLAHELGHAFYGHDCDSSTTPEQERQADRRGALLLVDPDAYARAEVLNDHPGFIARELGLTTHVVEVWRATWLPRLIERRAILSA